MTEQEIACALVFLQELLDEAELVSPEEWAEGPDEHGYEVLEYISMMRSLRTHLEGMQGV